MLLKRKFRPLLRALGIHLPRGNGFHAFRHANSTLMSSFGASLKLRQQRLGHADGSPVTGTASIEINSKDCGVLSYKTCKWRKAWVEALSTRQNCFSPGFI